jgi:hypothetical protein
MPPGLLALLAGKRAETSMPDERRIVSVHITAMPKGLFDSMPKIIATLDDGSNEELFWYYPDELSFSPAEFIGLTVDQGRHLKFEKDVAYLRAG